MLGCGAREELAGGTKRPFPRFAVGYAASVRWKKITLVGVGLLGGSLGLALKRRRLVREIAGYVRRPASVKECADAGAVDYATTDLLTAVWGQEYRDDVDYLRAYVRYLRRKLEADPSHPQYIVTSAGVGYMLVCAEGGHLPPPGEC